MSEQQGKKRAWLLKAACRGYRACGNSEKEGERRQTRKGGRNGRGCRGLPRFKMGSAPEWARRRA